MEGNESDSSEIFDWPEESEIGQLLESFEDSSCTCPICHGYYKNPHMLKCGHSYCYLCISKHLDKTINRTTSHLCPHCKEKASLFDLTKNNSLTNIVTNFKKMRNKLKSLLEIHGTNQRSTSAAATEKLSLTRNNTLPIGTIIKSRMPHMDFHRAPIKQVKNKIAAAIKESTVKLYSDGDKTALEKRFREFVHLHNAQVGSENAMTLEQVITEVNRRERERLVGDRQAASTTQTLSNLRNGVINGKVQDTFLELTQKARAQKKTISLSISSIDKPDSIPSNPPENPSETLETKTSEPSHPGPELEESEPASKADLLSQDTPKRDSYTWGPWRVVMSNKLVKPFYFNTITGIGQFACPEELMVDGGASQEEKDASSVEETEEHDTAEALDLFNDSISLGQKPGSSEPHSQLYEDQSKEITDCVLDSQIPQTNIGVTWPGFSPTQIQATNNQVPGTIPEYHDLTGIDEEQQFIPLADTEIPLTEEEDPLGWSCRLCTLRNEDNKLFCVACHASKESRGVSSIGPLSQQIRQEQLKQNIFFSGGNSQRSSKRKRVTK